MNNQEIYNKVKEHLLAQKEQSFRQYGEENICTYRGENGLKCAIGCLIDDDFYSPQMEGKSLVTSLLVQEALKKSGVEFGRHTELLLEALQKVHDYYHPDEWEDNLKWVASIYRLKP